MTGVRQALDAAWQHFQRGQWQQAEKLYLQVLQVQPDQVDALHLLAAIAGQTGRQSQAIDYLQAVLRLKPGLASAHNNLGNVFITLGKLPEAVASFREAVRRQPDFAVAHNNLGNALRQQGQLGDALASLQQAIRIKPDYAQAHFNLGIAWLAQEKHAEAQASFQQAVRHKPNYAEAHYYLGNELLHEGKPAEAAGRFQEALRLKADYAEAQLSLGIALKTQGKLADAVSHFQLAVRLNPGNVDAHISLGAALAEQRRLPEAVASFREAVRIQPEMAAAHNNLGNALREQGQLDEAEACLRQALRIEPEYAEAHYNLGIVLGRQLRLDDALASYQQAIRINPEFVDAHLNAGNALRDQGRLDDAIAAYRAALRVKPDSADAENNLGNVLKDEGLLDEAVAAYRAALRFKPDATHMHSNLVMTLHYHPSYDAKAIYEECRSWNRQHAEHLKDLIQPHANHRDPERRLRIGYVSPNFGEHVDSFFTIPLLSSHDHRQFEIFCYSDVARPDALTQRLRGYADAWRDTLDLSDQQLADMIRNDQIDILIDLKLHTARNRLLVFARKPAPVQVSWLGCPATTGLTTIDYRLSDPYLDPPGLFDRFYSEQTIRLPDTFWCYDPLVEQPLPVNDLPALKTGTVTVGCLNNFCKINDGCLALWAKVLHAVPQARLLLRAPRGQARERVLAVLEQNGIAATRVEFAAKQPRLDYLKLHHQIDFCLDPIPCNGHTTSLDAFWMGVPTITLVSTQTAFGRAGWSQLCNLSLKELAAQTPEEYVALAAGLAADLPRLKKLRSTLRDRMQHSPLMDDNRFARGMEEAYRHMWRKWCGRAKVEEISKPIVTDRPKSREGADDAAAQHFNLGNTLLYQGQLPEAEDNFRAAVSLKPDDAAVHYNLGLVLWRQGRLEESAASYRQALRIKPDHIDAHHNLGVALRQMGELADAEASLQETLRLDPNHADAHLNLGNVFRAQGRLDDAVAAYHAALKLRPNFAEAQSNLGNALKDQGMLDDAIDAYRTCVRLKPDAADMHSNLVFVLPFHPDYDSEAILKEARRWNQQHAEPLKKLIRPHSNDPNPQRRLRIGYVSPDFRDHVQSFFTVPLLSHLDHRECEIFCYASILRSDALTDRLRGCADVWRNTLGLSDEHLADLIRDDQIDILVDLAMHMANSRLLVFARKPAPVQVAWLAYPGTTGLSTMDYRLTDPYLDPPGLFDAFYSEESIRLPETFWCYDPLTDRLAVNDLPALKSGVVTFGCLNNFCKVNDGCLALWAKVLLAVPRSRLQLLAPRGQAREHTLARLQQEGVAADRVEFTEKLPRLEYLKLYNRIDIGLDPVPCNGHTTSLDGFWMGVPTITLVTTKTTFGRAGWSQLCNLGLKELAAQSPEEYVALAADLVADLSRLQKLRGTLRQRMQQSPLMDAPRFARQMEQAFRQMWHKWCQQTKRPGESKPVSHEQSAPRQGSGTASTSVSRTLNEAWKHFQTGRLQEAEQLYLQVLKTEPNRVDALHLLGVIAGQTNRHELAIEYLNAALRVDPNLASAHSNLGNVFINQRKLPEAIASFREAVRLKPDFAVAHNNLGNALREQGQLAEAVASLQQAVRLKPDNAEAHFNLGVALWSLGRLDEGVANYRRALSIKPDYADVYSNLGNALRDQGNLTEAEACLQQALSLAPDNPDVHVNLGTVWRGQGRLDEAVTSYRTALRIKPDSADAHNNLGNVLKEQGHIDDAIAAYRAALRLNPEAANTHSNLVVALHYHPEHGAQTYFEECRRWNQQHGEPLKRSIQPHTNDPDPERRLRIGYVSPGFRNHVDSFFTTPLLAHHDHRQFEIFCYADLLRPDTFTNRLRGYANVWRSTMELSDEQLADLIRKDGIDILVDLKLHTAGNRLLMFARKPAPVQGAWLGYPGTTGLSTMDYRLTDPYLDPPGLFDAFYSEESIRLPETFWCYDPLGDGSLPLNGLPALAQGFVTFGCLNDFSKINDKCLTLWAQILQAVPASHLLLLAPQGRLRQEMLAKLEREGIAPPRVDFSDRLVRSEYMKLYHRIDLALDPFPCNGHTTSLDAFWMGVPTVTLVSTKSAFGRAGWSQLCNLGLQELAADSPEKYVELASRLAADLPRLQEYRNTLRQRMLQSPLMDADRFARHMEQAYRQMWRRWCFGKSLRAVGNEISVPTRLAVKMAIPQLQDDAWKHFQAGHAQEAERPCLQILQAEPDHIDALQLLGVIAAQTGRNEQAIDYLNSVVRLKPDDAVAHNNLANVLFQQNKFNEAVASYRQALLLKPDYAEAHSNLGNVLQEQGHFAEAEACLQDAVRLKPDYAEAHYNQAIVLAKLGRLDEATAVNQRALELKPDHTDAMVHLGNLLKDQGRLDDAADAYRSALRTQPNAAHIHSNLLLVWHYHPAYDAQSMYPEYRLWNQQHAEPLKTQIPPHANSRDPQRRLRIGYVSADFREHVDSFFTVPLLAHHDRRQFEIFCFSGVARPDALTERLRGYADVWRSTVGLSDRQVADMIHGDQIDILVDLEMHMAKNRLLVFARKPAPVQCAWLGYPGTTGLSAIDYRLTDPYLDPPRLLDAFYSEESIRLPETFWCYDPLTDEPQVNNLPALERGSVTFGSLNNFCKVNDNCLALWGQVLIAVPGSRLIMMAPRGAAREHVLSKFEQEGIAASRVEFTDRQSRLEYLKTYHRIDLGLDTVPCNGHTTSLDALWMGVPAITLVSTKTAFGRAGWSQLCNLGLKELAADSLDRYVALAAGLAQNLPRLKELRSTLRHRMQQSPLMDGKHFARNMEQAYRQLWRQWCTRGGSPVIRFRSPPSL
jgi:predicted O-linked N-acetylglucosamine transferase (SPINDLY family)